jgi:hypothetical protein
MSAEPEGQERWQDESNDISKVNKQALHVSYLQRGIQHFKQL